MYGATGLFFSQKNISLNIKKRFKEVVFKRNFVLSFTCYLKKIPTLKPDWITASNNFQILHKKGSEKCAKHTFLKFTFESIIDFEDVEVHKILLIWIKIATMNVVQSDMN